MAVPDVVPRDAGHAVTGPTAVGARPRTWPLFAAPGVAVAGPAQVNSPYVVPVPVSWSDWPTGSVPASATPMSVLTRPAAGPFDAVSTPS